MEIDLQPSATEKQRAQEVHFKDFTDRKKHRLDFGGSTSETHVHIWWCLVCPLLQKMQAPKSKKNENVSQTFRSCNFTIIGVKSPVRGCKFFFVEAEVPFADGVG